MKAENGCLSNIEGHSNKTYLYSHMPKAYLGKDKVSILACFFSDGFPFLKTIRTLWHKLGTIIIRLKQTKQTQ